MRAVAAGMLANILPTTAVDIALHATGVFPPWFQPMGEGLWVLALGYRVVLAVAGGWTTARLAPARPMRHVAWGVAIGTALGLAGAVASWGKGPEFGPWWYAIGIVAASVPATWVGGMWGARAVGGRSQ